jgi:hypothetical protein
MEVTIPHLLHLPFWFCQGPIYNALSIKSLNRILVINIWISYFYWRDPLTLLGFFPLLALISPILPLSFFFHFLILLTNIAYSSYFHYCHGHREPLLVEFLVLSQ